jgi:Arc-like DNA binding domain
MIKRAQTTLVGLRVRMREPLRKKLEVAAKKRGVSLNAELVTRLEQSFQINSFEQVAEAQRAEIRRWAKIAERYEAFQQSVRRIDWEKMVGMWEKLEPSFKSQVVLSSTTMRSSNSDRLEKSDERQHHPTRKK